MFSNLEAMVKRRIVSKDATRIKYPLGGKWMLKMYQKSVKLWLGVAIVIFGVGLILSPSNVEAGGPANTKGDSGEEPNLVFPVISDTQIGRTEGGLGRFDNAMQQLNQLAPKQDAFVFIGDLTSHGYAKEYDDWVSIFNNRVQPQAEQLVGIGNHEYKASSPKVVQQRFLDRTGMNSLYYHKNIQGYDFLMMGEERGYFYSKDQIQWLGDQLKQAEQRDADKPIFVFLHHGIKDTTYGTEDWYIDNNNQKLLRETLKKYPQVVLMAGHTHYPTSDPRSIYQKEYTAINTGSIAYMWTEKGYLQGSVPEAEVSNGLLVKVFDDEVVIKRRNFTGERWVKDPWVIENPRKSKEDFEYTEDRDQEKPYFENDAEISVNKVEAKSLNISFTQAFDNLLTHSYKVTAKNQKTGEIANQYKAFSEYYKGQVPNPLTLPINDLKPATTYDISVKAIDAFGNTSENMLTTTAASEAESVSGMKNLVEQFKENGRFKDDQAPQALKMHLNVVHHYKKQDKSEKAIKHLKGFKSLVKHQKKNEQISGKTSHFFKKNVDHLLEIWQ